MHWPTKRGQARAGYFPYFFVPSTHIGCCFFSCCISAMGQAGTRYCRFERSGVLCLPAKPQFFCQTKNLVSDPLSRDVLDRLTMIGGGVGQPPPPQTQPAPPPLFLIHPCPSHSSTRPPPTACVSFPVFRELYQRKRKGWASADLSPVGLGGSWVGHKGGLHSFVPKRPCTSLQCGGPPCAHPRANSCLYCLSLSVPLWHSTPKLRRFFRLHLCTCEYDVLGGL